MPPIPYMLLPASGSDAADEWLRLGFESQLAGNLPQAQKYYMDALRLDPRHALAMNNLAALFAQSNNLNEALLTVERAAMVDGVNPGILRNWALMAMDADRIDWALEHARKAAALAPNDVNVLMALAMIATTAGFPEESIGLYNRILDIEPANPTAGSNVCFIQTLTDATPADLLRQRQRWYEAHRYRGKIEPHKNERTWDRPLRVGYVSGDFKSHSAAFIFSRVLLHHSPAVEMYLYSSLPVDPEKDGRTKQFVAAAGERWRDITTMSDEDADALIRKDKIDILVDLAGHTNGGRLALFTRKPAPVQVTAWGFAHGTGLAEMDYFFADPVSVQADERQHYAEKIIDLPCLVTMDEPREYTLKACSSPPVGKNEHFTYGVFTRFEKMSDECLQAFGEILRRVPNARLMCKDHALRRPYSLRRIMSMMPDIDQSRLLFSISTSHMDHMLAYQSVDLCLDPWPHCGGVVSLEQLYMGLPIITRYGKQPAGRNTSSVLTAMGRTDWIAKTVPEYIDKAVEWSGRTKELAAARKTLRRELLESPVVAGYVEAVEQAMRDIWRRWCES